MINEQAGQVKQACEPGDHERNMQALKPEIVSCHLNMMPKPVNLVTYATELIGLPRFSLAGPPSNIGSLRP